MRYSWALCKCRWLFKAPNLICHLLPWLGEGGQKFWPLQHIFPLWRCWWLGALYALLCPSTQVLFWLSLLPLFNPWGWGFSIERTGCSCSGRAYSCLSVVGRIYSLKRKGTLLQRPPHCYREVRIPCQLFLCPGHFWGAVWEQASAEEPMFPCELYARHASVD